MRIDINKAVDRVYDFFFTPLTSACKKADEAESPEEETPVVTKESPISLTRTEIATIANIQHPELDECSLDRTQVEERWGTVNTTLPERPGNFYTAVATYLVKVKYNSSLNRHAVNFSGVEGEIRDGLALLADNQKEKVIKLLAEQLESMHDYSILEGFNPPNGEASYLDYCNDLRGEQPYPRLSFTLHKAKDDDSKNEVTMGEFLNIISCVGTPRGQEPQGQCPGLGYVPPTSKPTGSTGRSCSLEGCTDGEITSNFARIEMLRRREILGLLESSLPTFDIASVSPRSATQGANQVSFTINGTATNVEDVKDSLIIDIGEGVTVTNLSYDGNQISATLSIASNASISRRDVVVLVDLGNGEQEEIGRLENGFTVKGTQVSRPEPERGSMRVAEPRKDVGEGEVAVERELINRRVDIVVEGFGLDPEACTHAKTKLENLGALSNYHCFDIPRNGNIPAHWKCTSETVDGRTRYIREKECMYLSGYNTVEVNEVVEYFRMQYYRCKPMGTGYSCTKKTKKE